METNRFNQLMLKKKTHFCTNYVSQEEAHRTQGVLRR